MKEKKHLSLRIDPITLYKLHYIAGYNGRSTNGEMLFLIRKDIEAFEADHGEIKPEN